MTIVAISLAVDAFIGLTMRSSPIIRRDMLWTFLAINVPLLSLDFTLTALFLRGDVPRPRLENFCVVLEATTAIVWVQMTGTVSSYFLLAPPLIAMLHRQLMGWANGLASAITASALHAGCFLLENAGVLKTAPLFSLDIGAYNAPVFRAAAFMSIQATIGLAFLTANFFDLTLREKDAALSDARHDLARAVDAGQVGRLIGRTIGDYRLVELLGRGGMGEVYHALHANTGAAVAIKVLHPHLGDVAEHLARFEREVEIAARLPRAAAVRDVGVTDDGLRYFVMELLHGEDLAALLRRRGRLSVEELLSILDPLAAALDEAHAAGIVHRDLKPQNVFLEAGGAVRLLDFGVAHLSDHTGLTTASAVIGTPGYLAPEQVAEGFGDPSARTDVFGLGAIVYRALTGQAAFPSRHAAGAAYEALHVHPPRPSTLADLKPDIDDVLAIALAKKPEDRYASASELARDLRSAEQGTLVRRANPSATTLTAAG
jgi:hypothetical protein